MDAFNKYILKQEYNKLAKLGDRLARDFEGIARELVGKVALYNMLVNM